MIKHLSIFFVLFLLTAPALWADISFPTVTKVYFEKGGQPYHHPVDFTITCFGYTWRPPNFVQKKPGTYTPENVFSVSAKCPDYGCQFDENYYMNYRHTDYCNVEGKTEGKDFKIENYAADPVDFSACKGAKNGNNFQRSCSLKFSLPQ